MGNNGSSSRLYYIGLQNHCGWLLQPWNWKDPCWKKSYDQPTNLDSTVKSRDITLLTNVRLVKAMVFPVVMYGCENWTLKKAEHQIIDAFEKAMVLEKTLESPLDCKEIQTFNPKGNQSWLFIGGTDAVVEISIFWPPDVKSWVIGKDSVVGRD